MNRQGKFTIPKPKDHNCFACGDTNSIGLNLQFYRKDDCVCSDITLGKDYEGWENVAHGGIISTLLDEAMSWAIMYSQKEFIVTRKMTVKYVRPVLIGMPIIISGKTIGEPDPPKIKAKAEIRDDKGRLYVRSTGEFVMLPKEELTWIPEHYKDNMLSLFDQFEQRNSKAL